ncbi:MAG: hypothetical protein ABJB01_10645 [Rudaea sp.]
MKLLLLVTSFLLIAACSAAEPPVKGYYRADGKEATLSHVRTGTGEPFTSGHPTIDIAFTEKDASGAKDLSANSVVFSNKYGSAILVNIFKSPEGKGYEIGSAAFHHSQSEKAGGNGGNLQIRNVTVTDGQISGEIYTPPDSTMFDVKVDIDLKFKATLPK